MEKTKNKFKRKRMKLAAVPLVALLSLASCEKPKIELHPDNYPIQRDILNIEIPKKVESIDKIKKEFYEEHEERYKDGYKTNNFHNDSDVVILARMLLGEVEACSKIEKIAVAYTAINRANDGKKWSGESLKEAILLPYQYSAFNEGINKKLKDPMSYNPKEFLENISLAREILAGKYSDPTEGATFYYNPSIIKKAPAWTKRAEEIGRIDNSFHVFYREKN